VRQRLLNLATEKRQDFGFVLTKYALERLLYRLSQSRHSESFVLKGALLFDLWTSQPFRPTRDADFLERGDPSLERFATIFAEIATQEVEPDGLSLLPASVRVEKIKDDEEYEGVRVRLEARLGNAKIPLQVDIGFGDVVTPAPLEVRYPTLLEFPAPILRAYPRETVVAEKFEALVKLGMANSRMKDFYDLWELSQQFNFDGSALSAAIKATFDRRRTDIPSSTPLALTEEFSESPAKQTQWSAFLRKSGLKGARSLREIAVHLESFLLSPARAALHDEHFKRFWKHGGPWSETKA
jgi:predicted nucleotidyltransferase component of viral defense system